MVKLAATPSQTLGPFFSYELLGADDAHVAGSAAKGEHIVLAGVLMDNEGTPVRDALVEVWQADAAGRYPGQDADSDPAVRGFGRTLTDAVGVFQFHTVLPGVSAGAGNSAQAPHFAIGVFAAGLMRRVTARIYVPDRDELATDAVLASLPEAARGSLTASWAADVDGARCLNFDFRLGGAGATTVFTD